MLELTITNEQKVRVTINPLSPAGKPALLDGTPAWEVQSGDSTLNPSLDGLSCDLVSSDNPGDTMILVKADANLGSGIEEISDIIKLSVSGALAANLGLSVGIPELK